MTAIFRKDSTSGKYQEISENKAEILYSNDGKQIAYAGNQISNREIYERVEKYCNPVASIGSGTEGEGSARHRLINVAVVIRHGDRTPIGYFLDKHTKWGCEFDQKVMTEYPIAAKYVKYMRSHKDQFYKFLGVKQFTPIPDARNCAESTLTPLGALQHLLLGNHLQERYFKNTNLFPAHKWSGDELLVESTPYARTVQSSVAFLYGFLPDFDFTRFQMKLSTTQWLNFCDKNCKCDAMKMYMVENDEDLQKLRMKNINLTSVLSEMADILEIQPDKFVYPTKVQDSLTGLICHKKKLPCGAKNCVNIPHHFGTIINHTYMVAEVTNKGFNTARQKYVGLHMQPLLEKILKVMETQIINKKSVKFSLFSAHDVTISPMVDVLDLPEHVWPPYASRLIFELWENTKTAEHFISIIYNGKNLTQHARFCRSVTNDGLCPLQNFADFVKFGNLMRYNNSTSYQQACAKIMK
ncbi:2-phosphoxylose phosphatase 1-like [Saccoglossus kowalevskii]|uniref:2-phosphoxylose phosphatase 1 n=1 Tax=Saccoglossus kowalevskii TaxID=10224 RepID=A0ABM0MDM1_SACKO|nr:PREDICTED: acid phosphatase-like protein 2-like [Saccoglossus kowalevskii]